MLAVAAISIVVDNVLGKEASGGVARPADAAASRHVPTLDRRYVSREAFESKAIKLLDDDHEAVALVGLPGVGKSQLAIRLAEHYRPTTELIRWIPAIDRLSVVAALAELAESLGIQRSDQEVAAKDVIAKLSNDGDWVLIYDNAGSPQAVDGLLPHNPTGRVILTSRDPNFERLAVPLFVEPFSVDSAADYLQTQVEPGAAEEAQDLAAAVGGLPLALGHIATYCKMTGTTLAAYRAKYLHRRAALIRGIERDKRLAMSERGSAVVTTFSLALHAVGRIDLAAVQLIRLLSFLSPAPIPRELLEYGHPWLPYRLGRALADDDTRNASIAVALRGSLLSGSSAGGLRLHQLVADIVRGDIESRSPWPNLGHYVASALRGRWRDLSASWTAGRWAEAALGLLDAATSSGVRDRSERDWLAQLMPHMIEVLRHARGLGIRSGPAIRLRARLGSYLLKRGDYSEALIYLLDAEEDARRVLGDHSATAVSVADDLARALYECDEVDAAQSLRETNIGILQAMFGPTHPHVMDGLLELAAILRAKGDRNAALGIYLECRLYRPTRDNIESSRIRTAARLNIADMLAEDGRYDDALGLYTEVVADVPPEWHDTDEALTALSNRSLLLLRVGQQDEAVDALRTILATRVGRFGETHPATAVTRNNLAVALTWSGSPVEARATHAAAVADYRRALGTRNSTWAIMDANSQATPVKE
ncbi:tetratricopeptide repeat protein [Actinoplanes sp. NPDC026619]|uniref:tetratricopeptide repeat protein n=1 Tax=Actinoplanes sp. NPDC026619 TaxID=3155798 RepID=UPI003404C8F4